MSLNILTRKLLTREGFMGALTLSVGGIAGLVVGIPIIGYVLDPLIKAPPEAWEPVRAVDSVTGAVRPKPLAPSDIPIGNTIEVSFKALAPLTWAGTTEKQAAWLRRTGENNFIAYAVYCTHLGCPIHWLEHPKIFLCPCHGSVFNSDGTVAGGPAGRPLFTYNVRVKNGRIEIKSVSLPVIT